MWNFSMNFSPSMIRSELIARYSFAWLSTVTFLVAVHSPRLGAEHPTEYETGPPKSTGPSTDWMPQRDDTVRDDFTTTNQTRVQDIIHASQAAKNASEELKTFAVSVLSGAYALTHESVAVAPPTTMTTASGSLDLNFDTLQHKKTFKSAAVSVLRARALELGEALSENDELAWAMAKKWFKKPI